MTRSAFLDWLGGAMDAGAPPATTSGPGADLVLGCATGYGVPQVEPFVRSLRAVHKGPAVLIVDQDAGLREFLRRHGVEAAPAPTGSGWRPHPVVGRFAAYASALAARPWARNVILTDVRDVFFQADPFAAAPDRLEFFEENEGRTLRDHAFDLKHLRALVGARLAGSILDRPCVCVGVVAGPRAEVMRFCRLLLALCAIPRSGRGGAFGADQAACNLIAHLDLAGAVLRSNYGRVATIGLTRPERLVVCGDSIVNPDGSRSPIVHQYDRHPHLQRFVDARWRDGGTRPVEAALRRRARTVGASIARRLPEWR